MSAVTEQEGRLLSLCDDLLARAKAKGASAAEVYAENIRQTTVSLEQNDVKGAEVEEHNAVGLRLFLDDRVGFAYVNRLDDAAVDEAIDDALTIARCTPGDPSNGLVDPEPTPPVAGLWDDALVSLPPDEAVARADELMRAALDVDKRVRIDTGSFTTSVAHAAVVSSRGVRAAGSETSAVYGLFGMAVDGDEVGSFDHIDEVARSKDAIDCQDLGARFGRRVVDLLSPVEGKSYRGRVLFTPEAFEEIFVAPVLESVEGDEVFKGRSRYREKLGKKVAASSFSLIDDGTLPGGAGSDPFDREGLPHQRTPIIEDGVLRTFLYDGKSARRAGAKPTGHAQGSARSLPSVGTTNVIVTPGDLTEEELLRELGEGLLVGRFSGSVDSVSGDFSGVAKGSFLVSGGERGRPVKETLLAGNAFDLLERVVALGSKVHRIYTFQGPWVLVDGLDVTAS